MAKTETPASPPASEPVSEKSELEASAAGLQADGLLAGDEEDLASLERARRQRDPDAYAAEIRERDDLVTVRVTEDGDGRISRGRHHSGIGEDHFEQGETFQCERRNALALKKRHFVELVG